MLIMVIAFLVYCSLTVLIYQGWNKLQKQTGLIWLNPMLFSILVIIPLLIMTQHSFTEYYQHTQIFSYLLEPAIVALGLPLYSQLNSIKKELIPIISILALSIIIIISVSLLLSLLVVNLAPVAVSLSLKSITTPIGLALTEQLNGIASITAIAIIVAGLTGGLFGRSWLIWLKIDNPKAQGLAIGSASHALGTACMSKVSYQHTAYSALALILSAILTAVISPFLIPWFIALIQ